MLTIKRDNLTNQVVIDMLNDHMNDMHATSPPDSIHALDVSKLQSDDIKFFTAWIESSLAGCIALKTLDNSAGEIKSMRTSHNFRHTGVGKAMLTFIIEHAKEIGLDALFLETGTQPFFEPARNLYKKAGFVSCRPFANYKLDPNSCFMTLTI